MGVDAHVTGSTTKTLSLSIRDMLLRLWIAVLFSHTEVNNVDNYNATVLHE